MGKGLTGTIAMIDESKGIQEESQRKGGRERTDIHLVCPGNDFIFEVMI